MIIMACIRPMSCDTFVVLPSKSRNGSVIFGKNSDRPCEEVQEIVYEPAKDHSEGTVQCTYIEVEQANHTYSVILSKPSWMWGAEMGANEHGVCIGNEAVWTKLCGPDDEREQLLGMDLLRLGLERGRTSLEAMEVIVEMLDKYGQGGVCSDSLPCFTYHNSFIICDRTEAWVLETAGKHWAAEHITEGYRNISNVVSIGSKIDRMSDGLKALAREKGWWNGETQFNFSEAFSVGNYNGLERFTAGKYLLDDFSKSGSFELENMMSILRHEESGICMCDGDFLSTSSQVSVLSMDKPCSHWFTGTPDPKRSVFKPFVFTPGANVSTCIQSPKFDKDPAKELPRFRSVVDRRHDLYRLHERLVGGNNDNLLISLNNLEKKFISDVDRFMKDYNPNKISQVRNLFNQCIDEEIRFYTANKV